MDLEKLELFVVYEAHMQVAPKVILEIEWRGESFTLCGKETRVVDLSVPTVEILTKTSTPDATCISGEAISYLREAIRRLLGEGRNFYTELKKGWNAPAFYWEVVQQTNPRSDMSDFHEFLVQERWAQFDDKLNRGV